MRVPLRLAPILILMSALAVASDSEKFAGTWQASAKGTVFLVLKVKAGEKISGTLNAGHIELDDEGELKDATPVEDLEAPIFFARVEGDKLTFDFQDTDNDVLTFELKLTGDRKSVV